MARTVFGNAFVSVLEPGSEITPHCGPTNLRVRCHLALQVQVTDNNLLLGTVFSGSQRSVRNIYCNVVEKLKFFGDFAESWLFNVYFCCNFQQAREVRNFYALAIDVNILRQGETGGVESFQHLKIIPQYLEVNSHSAENSQTSKDLIVIPPQQLDSI